MVAVREDFFAFGKEFYMKYRHELKHEISYGDMLALRERLSRVMSRDTHSQNGIYLIRSLYFDTPSDTALYEKLDGVNRREKFRIRYYNYDPSFIVLEKKSKINSLCLKESKVIDEKTARVLSSGESYSETEEDLLGELSRKMKRDGLRGRVIVDYTREAFVFPAGNVRVTVDSKIRTGMFPKDFLNPECVTLPTEGDPIILEVKWDEYLPDIVRDAVQLTACRTGSFSKYAACRIYG